MLTACSFIVAIAYPSPVALSLAYMTGPLVAFAGFLAVARKHFPIRMRFSLAKSRELLRESRTIALYQVSVVVRDRLERVLLPYLTGMRKFGFYSAGIIPADRLFVVPEGFITAFFPAISRSHHEDERSASHHVVHMMITSLVACMPLAILVTYLADPFSRILFKHDPALCRDVIMITIWAVPLRGLQLPMGCALQASGHHSVAAKTGIIATAFSLAMTIVLILTLGIRGACWSWVGRAAISMLFLIPPFMRTFPNVYSRVPFARIAAGLVVMAALLWGSMHLHASQIVLFTAGSAAAIVVYFASMVALRVIALSDLRGMLGRRATE